MIIRKMKIKDYDAVYSLWRSCKGMGLNNLDDSREGRGKFLQRNPETCLVATNDSLIFVAQRKQRRDYNTFRKKLIPHYFL